VSEAGRLLEKLLATLRAQEPRSEEEARQALAESGPAAEEGRVHRAVEAMARAATPAGQLRLEHFLPVLARFFDVEERAARALLERIDTPAEWMDGPDTGVALLPVQAGARVQTALASCVRLLPGYLLAEHQHLGPERLLVLEGGLGDSLGHEVWPGETLEMPAGSRHAMWGLPGSACLCAALLWVDGGDGSPG
jgi:anti-sigma factor ChrR (cupin superfamily)